MGVINVDLSKTNSDALLGKIARAETDISRKTGGVIRIFGELWFCMPLEDRDINEDVKVRVDKIEGVTLYVKEVGGGK